VTDSMWLVLAFHTWYVADSLYNEVCIHQSCPLKKSLTLVIKPSLFTTMDIVTDGFGFMLSVGDLVVVPFTYSLQARYLAFHPVELGPIWTLAILGTNLLGYYIFRTANAEKDDFRNGKNPKSRLLLPLISASPDGEYRLNIYANQTRNKAAYLGMVGTLSSSKLLVCRHCIVRQLLKLTSLSNSGDWIMGVAWCLPTAFNTPITYFYAIYFAVLLIHRQRRDDEACLKK